MIFMQHYLEAINRSVIKGDINEVSEGVQAALDVGIEAGEILQAALIPAMGEVGRLYEEGKYYVPEMLVAARAMKAGLARIKPLLLHSNIKPVGKVAVGTVKGDLHDIGKNLVAMMLEGGGFEIKDLGADVSPEKFVAAIREEKVDLVGLSALLTTTMPMMKSTIQSISESGLRQQVKIIVGGAPITHKYAKEIGADGYAPDASQAVSLAKRLIG